MKNAEREKRENQKESKREKREETLVPETGDRTEAELQRFSLQISKQIAGLQFSR